MKKINISEWALDHASLVWYFMIIFVIAGGMSYFNLGREEDPSFSIKTMVVSAQWPGATIKDTTDLLTDPIEKKLQELPELDFTRSVTKAGQTTIYVNLLATTKADQIQSVWFRVRNMINDLKPSLPDGIAGPYYTDTFGDVYGNIYAFTADGYSFRQLRDYVEDARSEVLSVPNIGKVEILGEQDEAIYVEFSPQKLATLGINQSSILSALQAQNAVTPSGTIETGKDRIALRVSGQFASEDAVRNLNFRVDDRFFRLSDVATVTRGYVDPPSSLFRFNGEPAIALAVGMKPGSNLLKFGEALDQRIQQIGAELPAGIRIQRVADQPKVVEEAVSGFTRALFEAVAIVMIVSFISLGMRAGVVVAIAVPLVLGMTFMVMDYIGITLQRISLGALIISLGLLVDDAMIAVEMMVAKLEEGKSLRKAAVAVYESTALPMLTGTLVTIAGFIPIGLNDSSAGEYTFTMFVVIAVSLLLSWVVAVVFSPLIGFRLLPETWKHKHEGEGRIARLFRRALMACLNYRWLTVIVTVVIFALSVVGMGKVEQQFFPASERLELVVDFNLPQDSSITETAKQISKFENDMLKGNDDIASWSTYIGSGAPRFLLTFDAKSPNPFFGQIIVVTKDLEKRNEVKEKLQAYLDKTFPGTDGLVNLLDLGPPVGRPIQFRVSGPDVNEVRNQAMAFKSMLEKSPDLGKIVYDWAEPSPTIHVDVLQDAARQYGVSSQDIASSLNGIIGGRTLTAIRDGKYLIDVIGRANRGAGSSIEALKGLELQLASGVSVPLASVARLSYSIEQPIVWRRDRLPTITLSGAVIAGKQPIGVVEDLTPKIEAFRAAMPEGYSVKLGGVMEQSAESQAPIAAVVPLMLLVMATVLMVQLQSFSRLAMVISVAPLGMVGVVISLLSTNTPMGFVSILGILALIGILVRNAVILVVQIEHLRAEGIEPWQAVVDATMHRVRPILLTAAAASLGLIPIASEVFWGPMAIAMMGGIIVGTLITLLFLPALYVAALRIRKPESGAA